MNKALLFRTVAMQFWRYRIRSSLLMLGILVGVFTLTSALSLSSGFKTAVLDYFSRTFLPNSVTLAAIYNVPDARGIREAEIATLLDSVPGVAAWTPLVPGGFVNFSANGESQFAALSGVATSAQTVIGQAAAQGEYFSEAEVGGRARVALLGRTVSNRLFGNESPVGKTLTTGSQVFTIKGVLEPAGADPHGGDLDNVVVIPYTTLLQMNKRNDLVSVRFRISDATRVDPAAVAIATAMRSAHNLDAGRQDDFIVSTSPSGQSAFEAFEAMFAVLLPVVTGLIFVISLLVIASVMLVAVKQRSTEIGLRKAVGARSRDVECQILVEVMWLALCAGLLGIVLSYPGLFYMQGLYDRYGSAASFMPTPAILGLGFGTAGVTGLLAAWLPARRAASLRPVEALR